MVFRPMSDPVEGIAEDRDRNRRLGCVTAGCSGDRRRWERAWRRIARFDSGINAMTDRSFRDGALSRARALDARIARGEEPGPLAACRLAVKNLFGTSRGVIHAGRSRHQPGRTARTGRRTVRSPPSRAPGGPGRGAGRDGRDTRYLLHNGRKPSQHGAGLARNSRLTAIGCAPASSNDPPSAAARTPPRRPRGGGGLRSLRHWEPTTNGFDPGSGVPVRPLRPEADLRAPGRDGVLPLRRKPGPCRSPGPPAPPTWATIHDVLQTAETADRSHGGRPFEPVSPSLADDAAPMRVALAGGYALRQCRRCGPGGGGKGRGAPSARSGTCISKALAEARAAAFVITAAAGGALHLDRLGIARRRSTRGGSAGRPSSPAPLVPAAWVARAQRVRRAFRRTGSRGRSSRPTCSSLRRHRVRPTLIDSRRSRLAPGRCQSAPTWAC